MLCQDQPEKKDLFYDDESIPCYQVSFHPFHLWNDNSVTVILQDSNTCFVPGTSQLSQVCMILFLGKDMSAF